MLFKIKAKELFISTVIICYSFPLLTSALITSYIPIWRQVIFLFFVLSTIIVITNKRPPKELNQLWYILIFLGFSMVLGIIKGMNPLRVIMTSWKYLTPIFAFLYGYFVLKEDLFLKFRKLILIVFFTNLILLIIDPFLNLYEVFKLPQSPELEGAEAFSIRSKAFFVSPSVFGIYLIVLRYMTLQVNWCNNLIIKLLVIIASITTGSLQIIIPLLIIEFFFASKIQRIFFIITGIIGISAIGYIMNYTPQITYLIQDRLLTRNLSEDSRLVTFANGFKEMLRNGKLVFGGGIGFSNNTGQFGASSIGTGHFESSVISIILDLGLVGLFYLSFLIRSISLILYSKGKFIIILSIIFYGAIAPNLLHYSGMTLLFMWTGTLLYEKLNNQTDSQQRNSTRYAHC